jgi:hypothetical protein
MANQSVTGRDQYIVAMALALAIEAIDRLPEKWRSYSDRDDMALLLEALQPGGAKAFRLLARATLQRRGVATVDGRLGRIHVDWHSGPTLLQGPARESD